MNCYEGEANALNLMNGLLMDILEASPAGKYSSEIVCDPDEEDGRYIFNIYPLQSNMVSEDGEDIEISASDKIHVRNIKRRIGYFLHELDGYVSDRSIKIDPDNGTIGFQRKIGFFNLLKFYLNEEGVPILDVYKMNIEGVIKNEPGLQGLRRSDQIRILFSQKAAVAMYQIQQDEEHADDENYLGASQISFENMPEQVMTVNLHLAVFEEKIRMEDNMDRDHELYLLGEDYFLEKRKCTLRPVLN